VTCPHPGSGQASLPARNRISITNCCPCPATSDTLTPGRSSSRFSNVVAHTTTLLCERMSLNSPRTLARESCAPSCPGPGVSQALSRNRSSGHIPLSNPQLCREDRKTEASASLMIKRNQSTGSPTRCPEEREHSSAAPTPAAAQGAGPDAARPPGLDAALTPRPPTDPHAAASRPPGRGRPPTVRSNQALVLRAWENPRWRYRRIHRGPGTHPRCQPHQPADPLQPIDDQARQMRQNHPRHTIPGISNPTPFFRCSPAQGITRG
jgi:hypothetical protein